MATSERLSCSALQPSPTAINQQPSHALRYGCALTPRPLPQIKSPAEPGCKQI